MAKAKKTEEKKKTEKVEKKAVKKKTEEKKPAKKSDEKKTSKKKKEEKVEIVEGGDEDKVYQPKLKPKLDKDTKRMLNIKSEIDSRRPKFRRQEWFRYKRLGEKWRKPRGLHSSMRRRKKYRPKMATVGFRGPKDTRDYHPSGFKEVLVYNPRDLKDLDPKTQAIRIGHSVGTKKRIEILKAAEKMDLRVLNRGGL